MNNRSSLLSRISVNRPVTITVCLVALLVMGAVAYSRIAVKMMPAGFEPPFLWLSVRYPGSNATPQEVEQQITRPLEERLRTIKGIERVRTYTDSRGVGAPLRFQQDADMTLAYNQLRDQLDRLKPELPDEVRDRIYVWKYNDDDRSIMWVGAAMDSTIVDPYHFLETQVQRPLERIDGVARVELWGTDPKEVMIEIDREQLMARGVNVYQMVQSLQNDNFALKSGYVNEGTKKFYVRSLARYRSLEEIGNIPIDSREGGVRLREVADVVYDVPARRWFQRIDGQPASSVGIKAESGADITTVCDRVASTLRQIETASGAAGRVQFNVFFNQGEFIRASVSNLRNTGLWGGLFAALVLLFFLRVIRMTAIITLSIPLCAMITITVLYFSGWSLNLMTMMGLMVGVGMVVDNAVVILENIYRRREKGESPKQAAVVGASEVAMAITMATLTTVVVFLPLMLMTGNVGMTFYLSRMGVPVIVMLVGSLFVALLIIPLASVRLGGSRVKPDSRSIGWARMRYGGVLKWALSHRRDAILILLAVFATISIPAGKMKRSDASRGNINDIDIYIRTPRDFSTNETFELMNDVEDFLNSKREAYGVRTIRSWFRKTRGNFDIYLDSNPNEAWWYVAYKNLRSGLGVPVDKTIARTEVIKDLKQNMPKYVGVRIGVESRGSGGGDPSVAVYLYGDDTEVLAPLVTEVERRLRVIPSVVNVDSDLERSTDEAQVHIDRERARRYGISPRVVARTLAISMQGVSLPRFQSGEREVDTRLYLEEADRQTLHHLKSFMFRSASGEEIPLSELASFKVTPGRGRIRREDGKTRLAVRAFTTKDDLKSLYAEIDRAMAGFEMPRGYSWNKGERFARFQESDNETIFAVVMAVTCVFLLMGVLFESVVLPFSVLFSIPFSFLGVYWTLYLTGTPMDMMANIGLIVLIGVVVNNAIVLVDMINRMRLEGMNRTEAILEAGHNRFRPILMTTFTTVFGLVPMALGNTNLVGIPYSPLGRTLMGGLFVSTFLTLLLVPIFYTLLDDLRTFLQRIVRAAFFRQAAYDQSADD